jgi:hypothetical protein
MPSDIERAIIVCTVHKGVFFGYTKLSDEELDKLVEEEKPLRLARMRMAPYWSTDTRSVVGLASIGPQRGSRISPPAESATVESLTMIATCSAPAAEAWEKAPWA